MTDAEFWEVERSLWLGGPAAFRAWVAADCVMVFPEPAGILTGAAILEGLAAAPRWERGRLRGDRWCAAPATRRRCSPTAPRRRGRTAPRIARSAASSYVQQAGDWWLVQHQQTPDLTLRLPKETRSCRIPR